MSTPARTPAAGVPHPAWPTRPTPPTVPGHADRTPSTRPPSVPATPARPPVAAQHVRAASAPRPVPAHPDAAHPPVAQAGAAAPAPAAPVVPPEEQTLDPRTIARASLAAGRNRSLWWTTSGIVAAVVVSFLVGAVAGTYVLATLLVVSAVVRGVVRGPGPVAVSVRSKPLDVAVLAANGVALAVLASVLPPG